MFCDHPAEKLGHKIPTLSLRFAKTRKDDSLQGSKDPSKFVFDHMEFVYLWNLFSVSSVHQLHCSSSLQRLGTYERSGSSLEVSIPMHVMM